MKKVFLICTIRSATQEYLNKLEDYVNGLESKGIEVYAPHRDTNQIALGYEICKQNFSILSLFHCIARQPQACLDTRLAKSYVRHCNLFALRTTRTDFLL